MPDSEIVLRRAAERDLAVLSRFGAELARQHVQFDADRFTIQEPAEPVFHAFFTDQLANPKAVVLVVELGREVSGYAFLRMEDASLEDLCGEAVWLHDIFVAPAARGLQLGRRLLAAACDAARTLGAESLMLSVSPHNPAAQHLFTQFGFRPTMVEMRLELDQRQP